MKPTLVWCVWYRGKGLKAWKLLGADTTKAEARRMAAYAKDGRGLMEYKITRHEVEGPR